MNNTKKGRAKLMSKLVPLLNEISEGMQNELVAFYDENIDVITITNGYGENLAQSLSGDSLTACLRDVVKAYMKIEGDYDEQLEGDYDEI